MPEQNLKIFAVSYKEILSARESAKGSIWGLKYNNKVGWITSRDNWKPEVKERIFNFDESDDYLYTEEFLRVMKWSDSVTHLMTKDLNVPRDVLLLIAQRRCDPPVEQLIKNESVRKDKEILEAPLNHRHIKNQPAQYWTNLRNEINDLISKL